MKRASANFQQTFEEIKSRLINLEVQRSYNSIGSNIFLDFGAEQKITTPTGKEITKREWSIWLGDVSW